MNFLTTGSRLRKRIDKRVEALVGLSPEELAAARDLYTADELKLIRRDIDLGLEVALAYRELAIEKGLIDNRGAMTTNTYMVTVRPDDKNVRFDDFYERVRHYVGRRCFGAFTLSFEQKGLNDDDLGKGFHVHIVIVARQRSVGELVRDTQSTFASMCAANCVQVDRCGDPAKVVENYLVKYESADGHKATTMEADAKWRWSLGLESIYIDSLPLRSIALSSPGGLLSFGTVSS